MLRDKYMNFGLKTIILLLFVFSFLFFAQTADATAPNCLNNDAPWNSAGKGLIMVPRFECRTDVNQKDHFYSYTFIKTGSFHCDNGGQCVRTPDCGRQRPVNGKEWKCKQGPEGLWSNWDCIPFHCYGDSSIRCCKQKDIEEPIIDEEIALAPQERTIIQEDVTLVPQEIVKTANVRAYTFTANSCCRQIVRTLKRDPTTGNLVDKYGNITDHYTLNDVVQSAINVYECILCIVGALMLIMIVFGATMMIISGGSADKVALGKKIILGAVVGGIIALGTYLIIYWTVSALGASFISPYSGGDKGDLSIHEGSEMIK
ncbi:MAG: pilin [bacterium]